MRDKPFSCGRRDAISGELVYQPVGIQMASEIGAYEAKTKLPELLREVQKGRRFTITHRGKPVADLVPSRGAGAKDVREAIDDMMNIEKIKGIDPEEVAAWIREGRT